MGRGEGRGWSAREERCDRGQEVVLSWRTVRKAIIGSHPPRHAQRAGVGGSGLRENVNEMRCMRASNEGRERAKRNDWKRMTLRTMCAGEEMLRGGQGQQRRRRVFDDDGT